MADEDALRHLILSGVQLGTREVGRGAFMRVFTATYDGAQCAAREPQPILLDSVKKQFLQECAVHSKLHHPNIVRMLGLYYPGNQAKLPVQILELMDDNLTSLLGKSQTIPADIKSSILKDVSNGLYYLHNLIPPMMHRDLSSNNILVKSGVAKICDFIVTKVILPDSPDKELTGVPGTIAFMPPEVFRLQAHYGLSIDVFSFGCVVCHVISQEYPQPLDSDLIEAKKRQKYIDHIQAGPLKQLVMECLDNDPKKCPSSIMQSYAFVKE